MRIQIERNLICKCFFFPLARSFYGILKIKVLIVPERKVVHVGYHLATVLLASMPSFTKIDLPINMQCM